MKCLIFFTLAAICNGAIINFQGEIRINGDRRIFLRNGDKMVTITASRSEPKGIEVFAKVYPDEEIKIIKISGDRIVKSIYLTKNSLEANINDRDSDSNNDDSRHKEKEQESELDNPQMKVLINIFKGHEGYVGEDNFHQILKELKQAIDRQDLNSVVYDVISELKKQSTNSNKNYQVEVNTKVEERTTESDLNGEAAETHEDQKRNTDERRPNNEMTYLKSQLSEAAQATRQIQWIQSILENQRKQALSNARHQSSRTEELFQTYDSQDIDLKRLELQTNIYEQDSEIRQQQLKSQQLQVQQQLLDGQKQQLKLHLQLAFQQGLHTSELQELRNAYQQVKQQDTKLSEEQVDLQKSIHDLQDRKIKGYKHLKDLNQKEERDRE